MMSSTSWRFALLPYLEQQAIFDKAAEALAAGTEINFYPVGNTAHTFADYNVYTQPLLNLVVAGYSCPSSAVSDIYEYSSNFVGLGTQMVKYVGIMGAYPDPLGRTGCFYQVQYDSYATNNGSLLLNECVGFRDVLDGTSNTIIVGEQSGNPRNPRISNYHSGWGGASGRETVSQLKAGTAGLHRYGGSLTAVFHTPNPVSTGAEANAVWDFNTPLSSFHPGGVQVLLADGSTHFATDTIELSLLQELCTRDDRQVLGEW